MSAKHIDPWAAPDPGFERYTGPAVTDGFDPLDSRRKDLADYLRAELTAHPQRTATHETVMLSNGRNGELIRRENGDWELRVHMGRDYYEITTAPTRDGVLGNATIGHTLKSRTEKDRT
jgi:hypothetical protein